jgi:hypothetical protein
MNPTPNAIAHFYRPLANFGGKVLQYAGPVTAENIDAQPTKWKLEPDPAYLPGCIILDYMGERIRGGTWEEFKE